MFANEEKRSRIEAAVAVKETEILAQRMLFNMGTVDPRELQSGLLNRLQNEYRQRGLEIAHNEDQLDYALALILVQHPKLLTRHEKRARQVTPR